MPGLPNIYTNKDNEELYNYFLQKGLSFNINCLRLAVNIGEIKHIEQLRNDPIFDIYFVRNINNLSTNPLLIHYFIYDDTV